MRPTKPRRRAGRRLQYDSLEIRALLASGAFNPSTASYVANLFMALEGVQATPAQIAPFDAILRQPGGVQTVFNEIAASSQHQAILAGEGVATTIANTGGALNSAAGLSTNDAFVTNLLLTDLGRAPSQAEVTPWVNLLDNGASPTTVLIDIGNLAESRQHLATFGVANTGTSTGNGTGSGTSTNGTGSSTTGTSTAGSGATNTGSSGSGTNGTGTNSNGTGTSGNGAGTNGSGTGTATTGTGLTTTGTGVTTTGTPTNGNGTGTGTGTNPNPSPVATGTGASGTGLGTGTGTSGAGNGTTSAGTGTSGSSTGSSGSGAGLGSGATGSGGPSSGITPSLIIGSGNNGSMS